MNVKPYFLNSVAAMILVAPVVVMPAYAQDEGQRDEIIVQARKRAEPLSRVPETIDALTDETIARAGIRSLNDVARQTPNIVLNRRQDNEPNVVIRGIGGFGNTQGIGFYIDDVQNFTDQSAAIEDVERIEILKGPQGTLYGGSNVGGAVKLIMKRPGDEFGAELNADYGSFDTRNIFGAVDLPLNKDGTLALRVSSYYNHSDGFVSNTFLGGSNPDETDEYGLRVALDWDPTEDLSIKLSYRHNNLENGGNVYTASATSDQHVRMVDYNNDVLNDRTVNGGIAQIDYDAGPVVLTAVSSYTHRKNKLLWDLDYSSADAVLALNGDRNTTKVLTQEVRLASDGDGPFDWIVGGYFAKTDNRGLVNNVDLFLGPDHPIGPLFLEDFNNGDTEEKQYAGFVTANYDFGRFRIGGGLRVNRSEFEGAVLTPPAVVSNVNDTAILPKITLAYDVADDVMLYANVARGFEPGKVNVVSGSGNAYMPETVWNYEIGVKGFSPDRRLGFDLAAFYIDYQERQFETQFLVNGVVQEEITNVGDSVSYGIEAGINFNVTDDLTLSGGAGWLHAEWDDAAAMFNLAPVDGLAVPHSPDVTANAALDYRRPIGNGLEIGFRADVSYTGSFYWDIPNTHQQDAYALVNLRLSLGDAEGAWEVSVRGENIFDEGYYNEYFPDVFGPGASLGAPGKPAAVMGALRLAF